MAYVGAIDQGTTSTRFMIFDRGGSVVASAQREHQQIFPLPGWVEHDPLEIWARTCEAIEEALAEAGLGATDLAAVGVTNQRETTLVWDRASGEPITNAIVWQDTRTADICRGLGEEAGQDRFRAKTGLPLATYFSGPKLTWILENIDGLAARAVSGDVLFGTVDSWLLWNLTRGKQAGLHITDVTNASRTLLMDLATQTWDPDLAGAMGVPLSMLPEIRSSSEVYGVATGPLAGVSLAGVLGDQQAALVGQACFEPGEAKNTYGTGCFMLLNTGTSIVESKAGLLTTVAYRLGDAPTCFALEGSVAVAGALVQWLRDNLGIIDEAPDIEQLAESVADNGGVYFVPAFSGLFAPRWRDDARGVIAGLTRFADRGHLARSVLEATAYQTYEVLEAMRTDSEVDLTALKVDGGMVANELLMQFQADLLGVPVVRPRIAETTALGVAYSAGLAVGYWESQEELRSLWQEDRRWEPRMSETRKSELLEGWSKAVDRTLGWV